MRNRGLWALLCALALLLPALLAGCEQVTGGDPALTGTVTVNGDARVGAILTANISALGGEGTVSYQWQRGGAAEGSFAAIAEAKGASYTLVAADEGTYLRVELSRDGYSGSKTSAALGPVTADGDEENLLSGLYIGAETTPVAGVSGLASALTWIASNAVEEGRYTIILDTDETVPPQELHYTRTVGIDIRGRGEAPVIQLSGTGSLLSIRGTKQGTKERKVSVSLENVRLLGVANNDAALVTLGAFSALELKSDAEISGNTYHLEEGGIVNPHGGGVAVAPGEGFPAELLINGGKISGNTVYAYCTGTDGFLFVWHAEAYGGGVSLQGGTLVMNSGEISGNTAKAFSPGSAGGAGYTSGGGIYAIGGSVSIHGGTISGNTAEATGGAAGGGVYASGPLTFSGGEISDNTVQATGSAIGGGVVPSTGGDEFTMEGGEISGNTVLSTAAPNKAFGGGVYLNGVFPAKYRMVKTGGLIRGGGAGAENNKAVNASQELQTDHGHAVYVNASGTPECYDGDISGNITLSSQ
jgi:hypothetical protein